MKSVYWGESLLCHHLVAASMQPPSDTIAFVVEDALRMSPSIPSGCLAYRSPYVAICTAPTVHIRVGSTQPPPFDTP